MTSDVEDLPDPQDPYWDEVTAQTLAFLGRSRAEYRRQRLRSTAYVGYVAVLIALVYAVPYLLAAIRSPGPSGPLPPSAGAVPLAAVAIALAVLVALVRDALWRGPALLDEPAAGWLLPAPIRRGPLLRPQLRRSLLVGAVLGGFLGGTMAVVARIAVGGRVATLALAGTSTGAITLLLGVGLAGLVQALTGRTSRVLRRVGGWLWLVPILPVGYALAWLAAPDSPLGRAGRVVDAIALWSGPWGWACQPVAAGIPAAAVPAAAGRGLAGTPWPVGTLAAVAVTVAVCWSADRRIARTPGRVLRARAASVTAVAQSLGTLQPRRARLLIESAQGRAPRTRWRIRPPRSAGTIWVWRDLTALLRAPTRALWGLLWLAGSVGVSGSAITRPTGPDRFVLGLAGLVAEYLAAAQLVEAARLDADDPRLVRSLPLRPARLACWHLVTPVLVLVGGLAVGAGCWWVAAGGWGVGGAGPGGWGAWRTLAGAALALPALAAAALVSAYRGDLPTGVMLGVPTPTGDTGPIQVAGWYLRGPLVALTMLGLGLGSGLTQLVVSAVAATVMILWARARAEAVLGTDQVAGTPRPVVPPQLPPSDR